MKLFFNLSLLMLTMLLCACGSGVASSDTIRTMVDEMGREKQVIKLAAIDNSQWLSTAIYGFNKSNENYHVEANYYMAADYRPSSIAKLYEMVDEATTRFNIDLAAGNVPDIFVSHRIMQTNSYISKGLFADINEFIDNDPDFNRADFLPSLFEVFDRKGNMYEISPLFHLNVIQAKTADVGTDTSWTLDEFAAFIETKPDAQYIIGDMTKRDFIITMTQYLFINPVSGEITFDRDEFKKILRVAERFPAELPQAYDLFRDWDEFRMGAKDGDPLMVINIVTDYYNIKIQENSYFGEETTLKGWPSPTGNGVRFRFFEYFSIIKPAENSEGAWEFLKYILYNAKHPTGYLNPMNLSLLDVLAEKEIERFSNARNPMSESFSRAEIDKLMMLYKSASAIDREDPTISAIIDAEIGSYLSGQRSDDTIIDIIENRIAIYLAEQD